MSTIRFRLVDFLLAYLASGDSGKVRRPPPASAISIGQHDVLLTLESKGTRDASVIRLGVSGPHVTREMVERAAEIVGRAFMLARDSAPFLEAIRHDRVISGLVFRYRALRPVLIIDPFEALLWAIMGQQLNLAFTRNLKIRLLRLSARQLTDGGETYQLFPRPEEIVRLDPESLRRNQFSRQKIDYIRGAARAVIERELDFDRLRKLPPDDALATLIGVKGIGRWTAEYVLVRALGVDDALPAADIGLRTAVGDLYKMGRMASESEVRDLSQNWAPWRGWVAFYLWLDRLMKRAERVDPDPLRVPLLHRFKN